MNKKLSLYSMRYQYLIIFFPNSSNKPLDCVRLCGIVGVNEYRKNWCFQALSNHLFCISNLPFIIGLTMVLCGNLAYCEKLMIYCNIVISNSERMLVWRKLYWVCWKCVQSLRWLCHGAIMRFSNRLSSEHQRVMVHIYTQ